jgi:cell division control protein 12
LFATEICAPRNYRNRSAKQFDKTTEIEILKADLEERGFNIKVCLSSALASIAFRADR